MLEMLKERKAALEARGKKGFTLMEMLIVIAIIAVLVAIAIPVLGAQLDRAKAATDEANIRDGYASYQVMQLQDPAFSGTATYVLQKDGTVKLAADSNNPYTTQASNTNLGTGAVNVGGVDVAWTAGKSIQYTLDGGAVKITAA